MIFVLHFCSQFTGFLDNTLKIHQHQYAVHQQNNGSATTPKPGYFKPLQIVKVVPSLTPQQSVSPRLDDAEHLPKAQEWKASPMQDVSKTAYGLPGYSGPEGFSPRRGATAADYSANVAGFVPEGSSSSSTGDKKSQSFMSQFEPSATEGNYRSAALKSVSQPDAFTRRYKERREPYSPFASASNEDTVSQYLKTADPHNQNNNNNQGNSLGHPMGSASSSSSYSTSDGGYGSRNLDSFGSSTRKKLSFSDDSVGPDGHPPQPFGNQDFHQSKHYFSSQVIRDFDVDPYLHSPFNGFMSSGDLGSLSGSGSSSSSSSLFSQSSQNHPMEHSVSASNDNELAQLAASMSDFSASPASSSPDFSSMSTGDQMSLADASGFGSLSSAGSAFGSGLHGFGSSSLMSGNPSFAASIPSPASVPGEVSFQQ